MPVGKLTGPLKFYTVVFHYTEHTTAQGVVQALSEEDATKKIFENLGPQVENLVITSVTEVPLENDGPVDMDNLPEGVIKLKH